MYGEMTDKTTIAYLEQCLDAHSMEQFEILLYKKTRKTLTIPSTVLFLPSNHVRRSVCTPCVSVFHACPAPRSLLITENHI